MLLLFQHIISSAFICRVLGVISKPQHKFLIQPNVMPAPISKFFFSFSKSRITRFFIQFHFLCAEKVAYSKTQSKLACPFSPRSFYRNEKPATAFQVATLLSDFFSTENFTHQFFPMNFIFGSVGSAIIQLCAFLSSSSSPSSSSFVQSRKLFHRSSQEFLQYKKSRV